jgi:GNAT superfamily N-acetyltransferase
VKFQRETLFDVIEEVQPLLAKHYDELCLRKDAMELKPRWDVYAALEQAGAFVILTARDDAGLAAYSAFFVNAHLHYANLMVAQNDVMYVVEEHRKGSVPMRLIRYCEAELRVIGAHKIVYHAKYSNNLAPLLGRLGYGNEEAMCAKLMIGA